MYQLTCPRCYTVNEMPSNFCRICALPLHQPQSLQPPAAQPISPTIKNGSKNQKTIGAIIAISVISFVGLIGFISEQIRQSGINKSDKNISSQSPSTQSPTLVDPSKLTVDVSSDAYFNEAVKLASGNVLTNLNTARERLQAIPTDSKHGKEAAKLL